MGNEEKSKKKINLLIFIFSVCILALSFVRAQTNITACGTFSTNGELYNLNQTLVPTGGSNCITFTGVNQTFDGKNFRIENDTFNAIGIRAAPSRNITLQNVILNVSTSSSTNAIDIRNSEYARVINVTILKTYIGFRLVTQNNTYVNNLTLLGATNAGVSCGSQVNNAVFENSFFNNSVDSFDITDCSGMMIKNSTIIQTGGRGIDSIKTLPNNNNLTIIGNTFKEIPSGTGISISFDSNVSIVDNDFQNVNAWITLLTNVSDLTVSRNLFRRSNVQGASPVGIDYRNYTTRLIMENNTFSNLTYEIATSRMVWFRGGGKDSIVRGNVMGANVTMLESFELDANTIDSQTVIYQNYTLDGNIVNCHNTTNSSKGLDMDGLKDSLIINNKAFRCQFGMVVNNQSYNSTFLNNFINFSATGIAIQQSNANMYFYNTTILNSTTTGLSFNHLSFHPPTNHTFDNLFIYGAGSEAVRLINIGNVTNVIKNSNLSTSSGLTLFNSTGLVLINVTMSTTHSIDARSSYNRSWWFMSTVFNDTGSGNFFLPNVIIAPYTLDNNTLGNQTTDVFGNNITTIILEYTENQTQKYLKTPTKFQIWFAGTLYNTTYINFTSTLNIYDYIFVINTGQGGGGDTSCSEQSNVNSAIGGMVGLLGVLIAIVLGFLFFLFISQDLPLETLLRTILILGTVVVMIAIGFGVVSMIPNC